MPACFDCLRNHRTHKHTNTTHTDTHNTHKTPRTLALDPTTPGPHQPKDHPKFRSVSAFPELFCFQKKNFQFFQVLRGRLLVVSAWALWASCEALAAVRSQGCSSELLLRSIATLRHYDKCSDRVEREGALRMPFEQEEPPKEQVQAVWNRIFLSSQHQYGPKDVCNFWQELVEWKRERISTTCERASSQKDSFFFFSRRTAT